MSIPVARMRKDEIIWLATHKCKVHNHSFLSHYNCYLREYPEGYLAEKSCVWDIECSNLNADYGVMLSYAILDRQTSEIVSSTVTKKEILSDDMDKRLVEECSKELAKYDHVITYYGDRFDWPYLRARAVFHDLDFPGYGTINTTDLYFIIRSKFKISRKSLDNACRFLLGVDDKTRVEGKYWIKALQGDAWALEYILEHNEIDVSLTSDLYDRTVRFKKKIRRSI